MTTLFSRRATIRGWTTGALVRRYPRFWAFGIFADWTIAGIVLGVQLGSFAAQAGIWKGKNSDT